MSDQVSPLANDGNVIVNVDVVVKVTGTNVLFRLSPIRFRP